MKRILAIIGVALVLTVVGFVGYHFYSYYAAPTGLNKPTIAVKEIEKDSKAFAYYLVFEALMNADKGLNEDIKYIAVDLTNSKLKEEKEFLNMVTKYCEKNHLTLLVDTFKGLEQKGYIKDLSFQDGVIISYSKVKS